MEEFADDHDVWTKDFMAAWQRMAEIGYPENGQGKLTVAKQNSWFGYYKAKDLFEQEGKEMPGDPQVLSNDYVVCTKKPEGFLLSSPKFEFLTKSLAFESRAKVPLQTSHQHCIFFGT